MMSFPCSGGLQFRIYRSTNLITRSSSRYFQFARYWACPESPAWQPIASCFSENFGRIEKDSGQATCARDAGNPTRRANILAHAVRFDRHFREHL